MRKHFGSGVNIHKTRSFPGADIGSDHDLVMMTFQVHLKRVRQPNKPRLRFDLEKLRDPDMACTSQATICGKYTPLIGLRDEDMDINTMITTYNTAVTDAARYLGPNFAGKCHGSPEMFSTSFMRGDEMVLMFNVRLAGGHLYRKQLFTWLSLVVSLMASFVLSFFPLDVLDEI